jgi:hypothetical protein
MSTTHTQGPWKACIYGGWDAPRVWSASGSVALLQHHESGPGEGVANAHLIAAAPELLESLETLLLHVLHYASMPHAHSDAHKNAAAARAIIKKAKQA